MTLSKRESPSRIGAFTEFCKVFRETSLTHLYRLERPLPAPTLTARRSNPAAAMRRETCTSMETDLFQKAPATGAPVMMGGRTNATHAARGFHRFQGGAGRAPDDTSVFTITGWLA